ncbi:hypothetical protein HNY73_007804 [Argiope bruennichi]|uniref:Uncharacterized protein n=1 Tax=Argiope bruennichi TaxID=94029 RepID=A0A8T0FG18_ARGBR|nr:hypothetical protein HNY73_007804 [Argiope bruennichi]
MPINPQLGLPKPKEHSLEPHHMPSTSVPEIEASVFSQGIKRLICITGRRFLSTCTAGIEAAPSATPPPTAHVSSSTYPDRLVEERLHARESHAQTPLCIRAVISPSFPDDAVVQGSERLGPGPYRAPERGLDPSSRSEQTAKSAHLPRKAKEEESSSRRRILPPFGAQGTPLSRELGTPQLRIWKMNAVLQLS